MPVYKDKQRGTWYYYFCRMVNGEKVYKRKRGFETKMEAHIAEVNAIENLSNENKIKIERFKLDDLAALFFEYRETKLKSTTLELAQRLYNNHIGSKLGRVLISNLKSNDLHKWKKEFIKTDLTESFYNKVITIFRQIIQFAVYQTIINFIANLSNMHIYLIINNLQNLMIIIYTFFYDYSI